MFGQGTDNSIISLDSRRARSGQPECFATLDAHWSDLADGRIMPHRDEVDPRVLEPVLESIFLLEKIAPGHARFRIAGQGLCNLLDMDLRGMPFSALFTPAARDAVQEGLSTLFDEPARCELVLQGQRRGMRGRMAGQILLLPLRDRAGEVTRAIGCLSSSGPEVPAPQRFDLVGQDMRTLVGYGTRPPPIDHAPIEDPVSVADRARDRLRHRRDVRASLTVISND